MSWRGPWPVRLRLILAFLFVGVPPMLGAAYLASRLISGSFERNVGQWLTETARFVVVEIMDREDDAAQIATTLTGAVSQTANETVEGLKAALKPHEPILAADGFDVLMIYDASGAILYSTLPFAPTKKLRPAATRATFGGTLDGKPVLVAGATVKLSVGAGSLFLFLGDALDTATFSSLKAVPSLQLDFFAVRGNEAFKLYESSNLAAMPTPAILQQVASTDDPVALENPPGDAFLAAVAGLKDQDGELSGIVFCGVGSEDGLDGQDQQLHLLWAVFLFGALIFVLAGAFVSARFVKPLRALSQGVRSVASGDFSQRVPEAGDKETVELAARFNAMAAELEAARGRESELRRKERLSTLGEAAMVIAHEVRNPLGIIKTSSDLVRSRAKLGPKEEQLLDYVTEEVHRIDNLLTEVLDFAHPKEPRRSVFALREPVDRIQGFLAPEMARKGLLLAIEDHADGARVSADRDQIYEALLNLVINAMDVVGRGGRVVVRMAATPGSVSVDVADNGPGVKPELRARIFNPFFTTKAKGTGLGLAKVATVVEAHQGLVECLEEQGGGACFRVTLPRAGDAPRTAGPEATGPKIAGAKTVGAKTAEGKTAEAETAGTKTAGVRTTDSMTAGEDADIPQGEGAQL
ncbi:Signal transduction histidine kinase [Rhizobiales bacterium GAS113]|nr:Signal transduction histidine kinase [Rhizobiales bacterium GAS113]